MIIGILKADSVLEQFQPAHGDYPDMFVEVLGSGDTDIEFRVYDVEQGHYPLDLDECDAYIITGSKKSVYDDESWIRRLEEFVRELDQHRKKVLGICFGHQLIAQALGGEARLAEGGWCVGIHHNEVVSTQEFMIPQIPGFSLISSHRDQVTRLPRGAELLASSEFCPNAMFGIGDHILTIQGHPEFQKPYSRDLIEMRQEILGREKADAGIRSLDAELDREVVSQWILKFLSS